MAICSWHGCKREAVLNSRTGACSQHIQHFKEEAASRVPDRRILISGGAIHGTATLAFRRETHGYALVARDGLGEEQRLLMSLETAVGLMHLIEGETRVKA